VPVSGLRARRFAWARRPSARSAPPGPPPRRGADALPAQVDGAFASRL